MKKIVALALCLVLALSLCATAFAVSYDKIKDIEDYKVLDMENEPEVEPEEDDVAYLYAESKSVSTVDGKTTTTVTPAYYVIGGEKYVVCDESIATNKITKDGKLVALVVKLDDVPEVEKVVSGTVKGVDEDDAKCGQYPVDDTLYVIDKKVYQKGEDDYALLNGKLIAFNETEVEAVTHVFEDCTKFNAADGVYKSAKCDKCGKYVDVVKVSKIAKTDVNKYVKITDNALLAGYAYVEGSATAAEEAAGVTSAKTFDAGIAMYVGMSLMAVTGSAVVIGKKKEF